MTDRTLVSKYKKAAHRLAETGPERRAYVELLRHATTVDIGQLTEAAADGAPSLYDARRNLNNITNQQLAAGLRLALALSTNTRKLAEFESHPFWDNKKPNRNKLLLVCLQFAMPPRNVKERKLLSKYAATVSWLVLQGYGPDNLARGVAKEGGRSACIKKMASWRRERKQSSAAQANRSARTKTGAAGQKKHIPGAAGAAIGLTPNKKNPIPNAAGAVTRMTSNEVRLRVRFVRGLRQKIMDRDPPADRNYFWARIRHRGDRISIIRIETNKRDSAQKGLNSPRKSKK